MLIVAIGGISAQFQGAERLLFGAGAVSASFVWFLTLSLCAGLLAPLFRRQIAWRVLEGVVATTMWTIASLLLWRELSV